MSTASSNVQISPRLQQDVGIPENNRTAPMRDDSVREESDKKCCSCWSNAASKIENFVDKHVTSLQRKYALKTDGDEADGFFAKVGKVFARTLATLFLLIPALIVAGAKGIKNCCCACNKGNEQKPNHGEATSLTNTENL